MAHSEMAVVSLGGKQHLVGVGDRITVNRLQSKPGESLQVTDLLHQEPVKLKVLAEALGEKISGLKFKSKVRYLRRYGHRQRQTVVEVIAIGKSTAPLSKAAPTKAKPKAKTDRAPKVKVATKRKTAAAKKGKVDNG